MIKLYYQIIWIRNNIIRNILKNLITMLCKNDIKIQLEMTRLNIKKVEEDIINE